MTMDISHPPYLCCAQPSDQRASHLPNLCTALDNTSVTSLLPAGLALGILPTVECSGCASLTFLYQHY